MQKEEEVSISLKHLLSVHESHGGAIYHARFCDRFPDYVDYFASVSEPWVHVYRIENQDSSGGVTVSLLQSFLDETGEDEDPEAKKARLAKKDYQEPWNANFSCCWASKGDNVPVLLFGGKHGSIKGIVWSPPFRLQ